MTSFGCLFISYYFIFNYLYYFISWNLCMYRCYGTEVIIYLCSVLGLSTELYPKGDAGCIFQYFYLE